MFNALLEVGALSCTDKVANARSVPLKEKPDKQRCLSQTQWERSVHGWKPLRRAFLISCHCNISKVTFRQHHQDPTVAMLLRQSIIHA